MGSFRIFSKIHRDIRKSRCTTSVNDTGGKFATGGKFFHQFPLCCWHWWQICYRCQRYRRQIATGINDTGVVDTGGKYREKYQAADTLNLKANVYIYVNSTTQRCTNKIIKIFLLEDFFHLPPVSLTPVVHLEPRISPRILEKIWNGRNGILRCFGETDSWKKPEVENLVTLSL